MSNLDDVLQPFNNLGANLTPTNNLNGLINAGASLNGNLLLGGTGTDNYNDLTNKPQINGVTLQGNKSTSDLGLFSGNYNDLTNRPSIPSKLNDLDVTYYNLQDGDTLRYIGEPVNGWENAPFPNSLSSLNDVNATSPVGGHALIFNSQQQKWVDGPYPYYNLTSKPTLNNVTISGDKTSLDYGLFSGNYNDLTNKPSLANVATSGDYDDLINTPTIPAAQVNSDWDAVSGVEQILNKPTLATVATSGSYNDLTDKPSFTTWQYYGSILSETGIAISLTYNDYIKMAIIRISGSTSTPTQTTYTCQLPVFCTPVMELQCYARYMAWLTVSVNRDVVIRGVDTTQAWQSGSILFPYS